MSKRGKKPHAEHVSKRVYYVARWMRYTAEEPNYAEYIRPTFGCRHGWRYDQPCPHCVPVRGSAS